jgi:lactoylglutathione lyase
MTPTPDSDDIELFEGRSLGASLTVADLDASLRWYRDLVGFSVHQEFARDGKLTAVSLRAGDVRILIGQDDGRKGSGRVKGEGFSLMIETAQDIDAIAARIQQRGGILELEPTNSPWGGRMFRLRDPDGFKFTISSPRPNRT